MAKDPAVLFFIAQWLSSTAEMDSDVRGWYLNLILHGYDKKGLPNDVEKLASLAGVKFSEYERFEQVLKQVLMQKLELNSETGRLENPKSAEILRSREDFKDKRQRSGNIGVAIKIAKTIPGFNKRHIETLKQELYTYSDAQIEEAKNEHVLKHLLKLYINRNINKDIVNYSFITIDGFLEIFERWINYKIAKQETYKTDDSLKSAYKRLVKLSNSNPEIASAIIDVAISNNYSGFFPLTNQTTLTTKFEKLTAAYNGAINPYPKP